MRALFMFALLAIAACGDNIEPAVRDSGPGSDSAVDAPIDTPPQVVGACLDRPSDTLEPGMLAPGTALSCDLLPPDFVAEAP